VTAKPDPDGLLCPSARCEPDALLIGIVGPTGRVGHLTPALAVDEDFVVQAHKGRAPEKRFRFAQPCTEDGCQHWTGTRCGVVDAALSRDLEPAESLPRCGIRSGCRWFAQSGANACRVCPLVVTDIG
jgi:hypothetical protein